MQHPKRILFLLTLITLLLVGGYLFYETNRFVPPAPPNPNGYETLQTLSQQLHPRTGWYFETTDQERAQIIARNELILQAAGRALQLDSLVAIDWSKPDVQAQMDQTRVLRELARAFSAARFAAASTGDAAAAVQHSGDLLRLGRAARQGGLMVDFLVGNVIHQIGLEAYAKSIDSLDRAACQQLQRELEPFPIDSSELENVFIRDLEFAKRRLGSIEFLLVSWQSQGIMTPAKQAAKAAFDRVRSLHQQLQIRIALRQFFLDNQRLPKTLAELSPDYLPKSLDDGPTDKPLIYRSENGSFELYSAGPDGIDNGGPGEGSDDIGLDAEEDQLTTLEESEPEPDSAGM